MSRHRRQASQVLPPEFILGNEPPRAYGLSDVVSSGGATSGSTSTTASVTAESSMGNPPKAQQDLSGANLPVQAKKPPPARSA